MHYLFNDESEYFFENEDPDQGIEDGNCWVDGGWVIGDDLEVSAIEQWFHGDHLVYGGVTDEDLKEYWARYF